MEALAHRATTDGERRAAWAASERIRARLFEPPAPLDADPHLATPGGGWPDRVVLRAWVRDWMAGKVAADALADRARDQVGRFLLPDLPIDDPESIEVEVLLQLSTLHLGALMPERDGAALLAFLDTPAGDTALGWQAWYRHLRGEATPVLKTP